MALRNIVQEGDPVLKKVCRPVTSFDARLAQLLDDMGETMLDADGMGLAGPQVGVMRRLFVVLDESDMPDVSQMEPEEAAEAMAAWKPGVLEFINPEIIETEGDVLGYEGCLSFPGQYAAIKRPQRTKVRAFGRDGKPFEFEGTGVTARCLCHETNHLDGVTIDDLAEYFYDPENPHPLDAGMGGAQDEDGHGEE